MEIAVILAFLGAFLIFDLCPGFGRRSKAENAYYILAMAASCVVLLLKAADLLSFDLTQTLTKLFSSFGFMR